MKSIVKTLFLILFLLAAIGFLTTALSPESDTVKIPVTDIVVDDTSIVFCGLPTSEEDSDETPSVPVLDKESLIGTWIFNDTVTFDFSRVILLSFESGGESYSSMAFSGTDIYFNGITLAYSSTGFRSSAFKIITITAFNGDDEAFELFSTFLTANALKQI